MTLPLTPYVNQMAIDMRKITHSMGLVDFAVRLVDCQMQSEVSWEHFEQIKIMNQSTVERFLGAKLLMTLS